MEWGGTHYELYNLMLLQWGPIPTFLLPSSPSVVEQHEHYNLQLCRGRLNYDGQSSVPARRSFYILTRVVIVAFVVVRAIQRVMNEISVSIMNGHQHCNCYFPAEASVAKMEHQLLTDCTSYSYSYGWVSLSLALARRVVVQTANLIYTFTTSIGVMMYNIHHRAGQQQQLYGKE